MIGGHCVRSHKPQKHSTGLVQAREFGGVNAGGVGGWGSCATLEGQIIIHNTNL